MNKGVLYDFKYTLANRSFFSPLSTHRKYRCFIMWHRLQGAQKHLFNLALVMTANQTNGL